MFAAMFQVRAFYWGWWRSASNLFKVCESVLHACTCTQEIMILLGLFSASHIHRQQCCYCYSKGDCEGRRGNSQQGHSNWDLFSSLLTQWMGPPWGEEGEEGWVEIVSLSILASYCVCTVLQRPIHGFS